MQYFRALNDLLLYYIQWIDLQYKLNRIDNLQQVFSHSWLEQRKMQYMFFNRNLFWCAWAYFEFLIYLNEHSTLLYRSIPFVLKFVARLSEVYFRYTLPVPGWQIEIEIELGRDWLRDKKNDFYDICTVRTSPQSACEKVFVECRIRNASNDGNIHEKCIMYIQL